MTKYNKINQKYNQQSTSADVGFFQSTISLQRPLTAKPVDPPVDVSFETTFPLPTAFIRCLSALEPMTCPKMEAAIVNAMAVLGINTDFLSMPINGTAAWTATNHEGENFSVCSLHIPKGILAAMPSMPITSIFAGRGCGRRFLANAVFDIAALAAIMAGGHLNFIPGGG